MHQLITSLHSGATPFAIVQKQDSEELLILTGTSHEYRQLADIPRQSGPADDSDSYDTISVVPFCQIRERGYEPVDDGERILTIHVTGQQEVATAEFIDLLPVEDIMLAEEITYNCSEEEYCRIIEAIVEEEIGNGEGANFVVPRTATGRLADFSIPKALTLFRSLVQQDYGTYWKFIFYDTNRCFIGSTPERHLQVRSGEVRMNPISGTFRKDKPWSSRKAFKADLLRFLNDPKEINELFMVVDEELKMMAKMCDKGGAITGPLLKEMSKLIHSEYILAGESDKDIFTLFRDSMFAATVVGSPVENACKVIARHMKGSRRYYGSALMLVGRDSEGEDFLDSPITIRTAEFECDGRFVAGVGATLVKDSQPSEELAETRAKGAALFEAILATKNEAPSAPMLTSLYNDDEIAETLARRNKNLSSFWFFRQELERVFTHGDDQEPVVTLIHNEDDFVYMLAHMFSCMGAAPRVVRIEEYEAENDDSDIVLIGPGPGNPNEDSSKITANIHAVNVLLDRGKPILAICLGHQVLCRVLGFGLHRKEHPLQGSQCEVDLFGKKELVGFYNTFAAAAMPERDDIDQAVLEDGGELVALRGEGFIGYQFHPESLLTKNGFAILRDSVDRLLTVNV